MNKKEYCIKTLNFIKERNEAHTTLNRLGISVIEFDDKVFTHLIESICIVINPKTFKEIKDWIENWLFDGVKEIITDNVPEDVTSVERFTDFLLKYY